MQFSLKNPIDDLDSDPEIRQMIEASEKDINQGKVYSTDHLIEEIKRGEL